uniref:Saposin B-type domain-containing protein n=1 Tax=Caenorhabditis tropicalis TaxID=1561998 RepID=A0A1I7U500_9PELO
MKLLSCLLLIGALFSTSSAKNPLCMICDPSFALPSTWLGAQMMIKAGCTRLGPVENACNGIVDNADLTASYPKMLPHLVTLKDIGCKNYCH